MAFLKISDPVNRDLIVKEYLELKKNIQDNQLSERAGEQQLQTHFSKFFKPITETQKAPTKEITEGLKPIKEGIEPTTGYYVSGLSVYTSLRKTVRRRRHAIYRGSSGKVFKKVCYKG